MWDLKCIVAALCFTVSNVLFVVHGVQQMSSQSSTTTAVNQDEDSRPHSYFHSSTSFEQWKQLEPTYIESRWVQWAEQRPLLMCAELFGSLAWFWLIVPVVQSAWVLSKGGKRAVGPHALLATVSEIPRRSFDEQDGFFLRPILFLETEVFQPWPLFI